MTLYLKYRPQRISELDTKSVREALTHILSGKSIPHAFLLIGPRGLGKTSTARIVAKALNCKNSKFQDPNSKSDQFEPCNQCELCQTITAGRCPDVIEIDAASNRGIDDVRELRDKARLAPLVAKTKIYIVDEVHMLTLEAANALLKILEEPPANTMFILCTTDPQRLPETVVSRCTVIRFTKPTVADMAEKLLKIAAAEQFALSAVDAQMIAQTARGSFRDGIKLLEQVMLSGASATETMGLVGGNEVERLVEAVATKDIDGALAIVNTLAEQGVEMKEFVERLVEAVRVRLLAKAALKQAMGWELQAADQLQDVYAQVKQAVVPQLPIEIWILRQNDQVANIEYRMSNAETNSKSKDQNPKVSVEVKQEIPKAEIKTVVVETVGSSHKLQDTNHKVENVVLTGEDMLPQLTAQWEAVMKAIRTQNHSVEALLKSTKPVQFDGQRLTLEVFYMFHKDKLETEKCRSLVESCVQQVLGVPKVKLQLKVGSKQGKKEEITGVVSEDIVAAAAEIFKVEAI